MYSQKGELVNRMKRSHLIALITASTLVVTVMFTASAVAGPAWPAGVSRVAVPTVRVAGPSRFSTAVSAARVGYPGWVGVHDVIIASGDDRAASDPLSASGLCWALDAPLLLTSAKRTPAETAAALREIVAVNGPVNVIVVGGRGSVPAKRITELGRIVGAARVQQPWRSGSRYQLAAGVASHVRALAASQSRAVPSAVLVANGERSEYYYDSLAASAIVRHTGIPLLLTRTKKIPAETLAAMNASGASARIAVGGEGAISGTRASQMGITERWGGPTRFVTAAEVARGASARGWGGESVAVAVSLSDALAGAGLVGRSGGVVLFSGPQVLDYSSWAYLAGLAAQPTSGYLLGGNRSASDGLLAELNGAPATPWFGASTPGGGSSGSARVAGGVGGNTTQVALLIDGVQTQTSAVTPWSGFDFGEVAVPTKGVTVEVVASNPDGKTAGTSRKVSRISYPYKTCIIIVKHEFKLYWIKNGELVKVYPIAIGKEGWSTPVGTWKILAKYKSSGVYGPRKMRMFRKRGSGYVFSAYNIHGTNQEWVIGSRASHGCIRMYNKDVMQLWPQVPMGTMVLTRD